jgi:hypothetical protein
MSRCINKIFFVVCFCTTTLWVNGQTAMFVLFPDTQTYLESCPKVLEKQINVIVEEHPSVQFNFIFENVNF